MTIATRVARVERRAGISDPYSSFTDAELEAAIVTCDAKFLAAYGMNASAYAQHLLEHPDASPDEETLIWARRLVDVSRRLETLLCPLR